MKNTSETSVSHVANKPLSSSNGDTATIFSCCTAVVLSLVYVVLRLGFDDLHLAFVIKTLGVSFFILSCSRFLRHRLREPSSWYLGDSILMLSTLLLLVVTGMLVGWAQEGKIAGWFISFCGYGLFAALIYRLFLSRQLKSYLIIIALAGIFGVWLACIFWGYGIYSPLHFESFSVQLPHVDSLFHTAIAEMIRTYGVSSIGIEGIRYFPYHFGSHFAFAQLSHLLDMDMILFYPLAFPIIVLPIFFASVLQFIYSVKGKLADTRQKSPSILFWLVFFAGFIGVIGFNYLNKAGTASYAIILSESYSLSLIVFFTLLDVCLHFWNRYSQNQISRSEKVVFAIVTVPVLLVVIGFVKISTLYIGLALAGYTFVRLKLFKDLSFVASIGIAGTASVLLLVVTHQFNRQQGELHFFHYFKEYIDVPMPAFILLFYWWLFALAFLLYYRRRASQRVSKKPLELFALELVVVAALAGLLPASVLQLYGGSANYFLEPQRWLALALTLSYLTSIEHVLVSYMRKRKIMALAAGCIIVFFISRNLNHHSNLLEYKNLSVRTYMSEGSDNTNIPRRKLLTEIFEPEANMIDNITKIMYEPQARLKEDREFKFFTKLRELREIEDKEHTMLFIENKHALHSTFSCNAIPLAIPALTSMATIHGIPYDYCPAEDYGFDQFALESRTEIGKVNKPQDLCLEVKKNSAQKLVILHYDNYSVDFEYINCGTY